MKLRVDDWRVPPDQEALKPEPPKAADPQQELSSAPNKAPYSSDLEAEVLGSAIIDPDVMEYALQILRPADFYGEAHRRIWRAMVALAEQDQGLDMVTVLDEMRRQPGFNGGDLAVLMNAHDLKGTAAYGFSKVDRLREYGDRRQVMRAAELVIGEALRKGSKPALAKLEALLPALSDTGADLSRALDIAKRYAYGGALIPTGYASLDKATNGGIPRNDFTLVCARSSIGKSQFLYPVANHIGATTGLPFTLITPDTSISDILAAEAARQANTSLTRLMDPTVGRQRYLSAVDNLHQNFLKNVNLHQGSVDVNDIERIIRRAIRQGTSGIAVDTLNRVRYGREGKTAMLADLGTLLKDLAIDNDIPVIGLGQIKREVDERQDKRPTSADIADAPGTLYNDANMILLLYRDGRYYPTDAATEDFEVRVEKHKLGRTGYIVRLAYERALAKVYDPRATKPREKGLFDGHEEKDKPKVKVPARPPAKD